MIGLILSLIIGVVGGIAIGWWLWGHGKGEFVRQLSDKLRALANGEYQTRMISRVNLRGYEEIMTEFNEMSRKLEHQFINLSNERDVLRHILREMTTGVVYVNNRGRITMVNAAAERMFKRPTEQWIGNEHWSIFRQYQMGALIDETSLNGKSFQKEIQLQEEGSIVNVQMIPVTPPQTSFNPAINNDVLVIFNDVSEWHRLERMRTEFVANVSHELKTPVAAIRGFAETLLEEGMEDEDIFRRFLQTIYDEAYRMGNLVSDLLELSKLEGTHQAVQPTEVQLSTVVESAVSRVAHAADKRSIDVTVQLPDMAVWADEDKLLQVFLNLLTNAINYTPERGTVTVWGENEADKVKIHIQDTGIGISAEHQTRVFERFYRVNRDRSRSTGGTGLGLAIVKHIIGAHGGQVGVNSTTGRGSDFWFTLSRLGTTES